jgi:phosphatidylglycerol:prolipoprotein diacylglycerol transferase
MFTKNIKTQTMQKAVFVTLVTLLLIVFVYVVSLAFLGDVNIPSEIKLGSIRIRFYGIIILLSVIASSLMFDNFLKKRIGASSSLGKKVKRFDIYEMLTWAVIPGVILARVVYYLSFINEYYGGSFIDLFKIWNGGLSIFGALIGGVLGIIIYLKVYKIPLFPILDLVFIVIPLGHAIGRWANFVNQEIFGPPTNLPWKMYISLENRPLEYINKEFFHPLFLYEFFLNLFIFWLMFYLYKIQPKRMNGFFIALYLVMYGLVRFAIEFLRFDPKGLFGLSVAQYISAFMLFAGLFWLVYNKMILRLSLSGK